MRRVHFWTEISGRLPEIAADRAAQSGALEGVEHLEEQVRGVGDPEAAAAGHPVAAHRLAEKARIRRELVVVAAVRASVAALAVASHGLEGAVDPLGEAVGVARSTTPRTSRQPSRRIPARSTSGRELLGASIPGEVAVSIREAVEGGLRVGRSSLGALEPADPDGVPKCDELDLGVGVGRSCGSLG